MLNFVIEGTTAGAVTKLPFQCKEEKETRIFYSGKH